MNSTLDDPEARRAHLVLHGQTLLDEWTERCRLRSEVNRLSAEVNRLSAEAAKDWSDSDKIDNLWREAAALNSEARRFWDNAVAKEGCTLRWDGAVCVLSNGERYEIP